MRDTDTYLFLVELHDTDDYGQPRSRRGVFKTEGAAHAYLAGVIKDFREHEASIRRVPQSRLEE